MAARRRARARPAAGRELRDLVLNPSLDLELLFSVSVPGLGLSKRVLRHAEHPELLAALVALRAAPSDAAIKLDETLVRVLCDEHVLVRADAAPMRPTFQVDASPLLRELLPAHPSCPRLAHDDELVLTPGLVLQVGPRRPAQLTEQDQLPAPIAPGRAVLWVPDARTQRRRPHWLSQAARRALTRYRRGARISASVETAELALYGALCSPLYQARAHAAWRKHLAIERKRLAKQGYAVLRGLFSGLQLAALRRYTRALREQGYFDREPTTRKVGGRLFMYQEPAVRSLHAQLASILNELTPAPVLPSYCYLSTYARGSQLPRHVDREQCEWNLSLVIDAEPELPTAEMWPIHLEIKGGPARVALGIGDAVLYSGTRVPHWREPLSEQDSYTACFYHFVPLDFAGALG